MGAPLTARLAWPPTPAGKGPKPHLLPSGSCTGPSLSILAPSPTVSSLPAPSLPHTSVELCTSLLEPRLPAPPCPCRLTRPSPSTPRLPIPNAPAAPKVPGTAVCGLRVGPQPLPGGLPPPLTARSTPKAPLARRPAPALTWAGRAGAGREFHWSRGRIPLSAAPGSPGLYMAFPSSRPSRETSGKLEKLPEGAPAPPKKAKDLPQTAPAPAPPSAGPHPAPGSYCPPHRAGLGEPPQRGRALGPARPAQRGRVLGLGRPCGDSGPSRSWRWGAGGGGEFGQLSWRGH